MTDRPDSPPGDAPRGFFERHPWKGAGLFLLVIVVVGLVLVFTIGERPHYRGAKWQLFTDREETGAVTGAAEYTSDPVRLGVMVRTQTDAGEPVIGVEAALMTLGDMDVVSSGVSGAPGGHVRLPVPGRFEEQLFGSRMGVVCFLPGSQPWEAQLTPPKKDQWMIHCALEDRIRVALQLVEMDGQPTTAEARVLPHAVEGQPDPRQLGIAADKGRVDIGGWPRGKPSGITVFVADGRLVTCRVDPEGGDGKIPLPALSACVRGRVVDISGAPVAKAFIAVFPLDGQGEPQYRQLRDAEGDFAITAPPGRFRLECSTEGGPGRSGVLEGASENVELKAAPSGRIHGRIAEPQPEAIVALFDPDNSVKKPLAQAQVQKDGSFELTGLAPGTWDLELRRPNRAHVRLKGLLVPAGDDCHDERLRSVR